MDRLHELQARGEGVADDAVCETCRVPLAFFGDWYLLWDQETGEFEGPWCPECTAAVAASGFACRNPPV